VKALDALLNEAVTTGVAPLVRLEVFRRGAHVISKGNAHDLMEFDLASLTKIMCTTALCLRLVEDRWMPLDAELQDLLFHRSGLPAFKPFFADAIARFPALLEPSCPEQTRAAARAFVVEAAQNTPRSERREAVYSDVGFIILGEKLAQMQDMPLDELFFQFIARPLGLDANYRRLSRRLPLPARFAPTGATRPREPAIGQEGMWSTPTVPTQPAEVDDDNAWAMDGVSGHAGLFGSAYAVARFGQAVLDGQVLPPGGRWLRDPATPGSTRALGFDTPSAEGSAAGTRLGRGGPKGAIGHTGFTGTSLWIDLDRELSIALCTNRVALGRANLKIRDFRPRLHDAVLDALEPQFP
jgi:CubicO group peptidase (beta-lactamase class C family)